MKYVRIAIAVIEQHQCTHFYGSLRLSAAAGHGDSRPEAEGHILSTRLASLPGDPVHMVLGDFQPTLGARWRGHKHLCAHFHVLLLRSQVRRYFVRLLLTRGYF